MKLHPYEKDVWRQKKLRYRVFRGIGTQFALLTSLVLLSTLLFISVLNLQEQRIQIRQELSDKGRLLGHFVAMISPDAIYSYDFTTLNDFVKEISLHDDIIYSLVVSQQQQALTSFLDPDHPLIHSVQQAYPDISSIGVVQQLKQRDDIIHLELPIETNTEKLGEVWVGISMQRATQLLENAAIKQLWLNLLLAVFIGLGVLFTFKVKVLHPIHKLIQAAHQFSHGNFSYIVEINTRNEFSSLADSLNSMMRTIQQNNESLNNMIETLTLSMQENAKNSRENAIQTWLKTGLTELNARMSGEQELQTLADNIIQFLPVYIEAQMGAFYLLQSNENKDDEAFLAILASYNYSWRKQGYQGFKLGEDAVGQAALERKAFIIIDPPDEFQVEVEQEIKSAKSIIIQPILYETELRGVIELASIKDFSTEQLNFLKQAAVVIGIAVNTAQSRARMQELLQQLQAQSIHLQA